MAQLDRYGEKRPVWRDVDMRTATCAVVSTDNFGGDNPDERLVCLCWHSREFVQKMADAHNSESSPVLFKVVDLDYVLQPGFRP